MKKIFGVILFVLTFWANSFAGDQYMMQMIDIEHGSGFWQNGYVLYNTITRDALIVDPGQIDQQIESFIHDKNLIVQAIFNTHGHGDHVGGNAHYQELYKV
ncbi:MBL fold metallo-hydrolase [Ancylomarina euxinus]|uniref:MBL fold metallo-hydrolase n=1 Tax=Ancylomarina euxinus TaxID=2283627 RepID=A0A425Y2E9_9BACT|nr:MBL fold metallo-hydrolase [Ancylomarina euxinus]MCZ4694972.1 MBL fold metallo-hydrolase [Ancylomarina euxinus]MUP14837.1 MBL fold metallo-hydrolase [Ancylomarina euxinus]RRG22180.1 MBL fold metallo-hydrolase [Ancylomarina euxinus]